MTDPISSPRTMKKRGCERPDPPANALIYSFEDSRRLLGDVGRTTFWEWRKRGLIETIKIKGREFAKGDSVRRLAAHGASAAA
jgi:hypothetical protein